MQPPSKSYLFAATIQNFGGSSRFTTCSVISVVFSDWFDPSRGTNQKQLHNQDPGPLISALNWPEVSKFLDSNIKKYSI